MNFLRNNLANILTLSNLFFGCIAITFLFEQNILAANYCIATCLVLDFFDGFTARALKANSNLGGQLDSLADMVSFGVVPSIAMMNLLAPLGDSIFGIHFPFAIKYLGFFIAVFSCLRLAIFTIDSEQSYYFKGLNTPSNTILILGICSMVSYQDNKILESSPTIISFHLLTWILFIALSSWLLVSPIKMIAFKFKSKKIKDNIPSIILILGSLLLLCIGGLQYLPLVIIYYILVSLVFQKHIAKSGKN